MSEAEPDADFNPTPVVRRQFGDAWDALLSGSLLVSILAAILLTWAIGIQVVPSIGDAHASHVYAQESNPTFLSLRAGLWYAHSAIFVLAALLLSMRLWRRKLGNGLRARWYWTLIAFGLFAAWSFTSSLLPLDQSAWHGTIARKGVIEATPIVGQTLSEWLFPNGQIDKDTYSTFQMLSVGVFPALMLLVSLGLWGARTRTRQEVHGIGMLVGALLLALGAFVYPDVASLNISPRAEFAEVRAEWFFLPLSILLKEASGQSAGLADMIALSPAILIGLLVVIPFLSGKWHWHLDRIALGLTVFGFAAVLAFGLWEDATQYKGAFHRPDLDSIMGEMGKLNKQAGSEGRIAHNPAYRGIADLLVLTDQTYAAADYAEDIKDANEWRRMTTAMREAALEVWKSSPDQLEAAYSQLRDSCQTCHDAYEEEVTLRRFAFDQTKPNTESEVKPEKPEPTTFSGYSPEAVLDLKPTVAVPASFEDSKAYRRYMKDLMKLTKRVLDEPAIDVLQDLVDLKALIQPMHLDDDTLRQWMLNEGEYLFEDDLDHWRQSVTLSLESIDLALSAKNLVDWSKGVNGLRDGCNNCHGDYYMGDDEIEIPPLRAR